MHFFTSSMGSYHIEKLFWFLMALAAALGSHRANADTVAKKPLTDDRITIESINPGFRRVVQFNVDCVSCPAEREPQVQLTCYQGDVMVFGRSASAKKASQQGFFMAGEDAEEWAKEGGGPAKCKAELFYWSLDEDKRMNFLTSVDFETTEY